MALTVEGYTGGGKLVIPTQVYIATPPAKTNYAAGDALDLSGIVVKVKYSDDTEEDITSQCEFTPAAGTSLYESNTKIEVAWTWENTITYGAEQPITVQRMLQSIDITTEPTTKTYYKGETLSLAGMVVTATFTSGATEVVTASCTSSPAAGTAFNSYGTVPVTVSYAENGVTKTDSFSVTVTVKVVTWAGGTDQEIVNMVEAHYSGIINLHDYWAVGQERKVSLAAMAATGVGESHAAQDVTMVLMNKGGKELVSGGSCAFVVGQKNGLAFIGTGEYGYMNSSNTNSGGWESCARRTWCNNVFRNAIPSALRGIFKQFKNVTANGSGTGTATSNDYFALPAEKEVFGSVTYANGTAEASLTQFDYYKTSGNRIKKQGDDGSAGYWWERSPHSGNSASFCRVHSGGTANYGSASGALLLAPFGCI